MEWSAVRHKKIDISGGEVKYKAEKTDDVTAIRESEEVSISGGKIYAENTNSSGRAFAISTLDKTNYHYQVILIYLLQVKIRMDRYIMVTVLNPVLLLLQ